MLHLKKGSYKCVYEKCGSPDWNCWSNYFLSCNPFNLFSSFTAFWSNDGPRKQQMLIRVYGKKFSVVSYLCFLRLGSSAVLHLNHKLFTIRHFPEAVDPERAVYFLIWGTESHRPVTQMDTETADTPPTSTGSVIMMGKTPGACWVIWQCIVNVFLCVPHHSIWRLLYVYILVISFCELGYYSDPKPLPVWRLSYHEQQC